MWRTASPATIVDSVLVLAYLHFSSAPVFTELTAVVRVIGPSESKLAMVSSR